MTAEDEKTPRKVVQKLHRSVGFFDNRCKVDYRGAPGFAGSSPYFSGQLIGWREHPEGNSAPGGRRLSPCRFSAVIFPFGENRYEKVYCCLLAGPSGLDGRLRLRFDVELLVPQRIARSGCFRFRNSRQRTGSNSDYGQPNGLLFRLQPVRPCQQRLQSVQRPGLQSVQHSACLQSVRSVRKFLVRLPDGRHNARPGRKLIFSAEG